MPGSVPAPAAPSNATSGSYTPTLTGVVFIDSSTPYLCMWSRVSNIVTVTGHVAAVSNNAGAQLGISIPVATHLTSDGLVGVVTPSAGTAHLRPDTVGDVAVVEIDTAVTADYYFVFSYIVT